MAYRVKVFEKTRSSIAPYFAPGFNVFDFIRPDENCLSDILACLLDPKGDHAQGEVFLEQFVHGFCGMSRLALYEEVSVKRESRTGLLSRHRRCMDILIHVPGIPPVIGDFGIAIENKPWATDQQDQVRDYIQELQRRYDDQFKLIYLSGQGREPTSLSKGELEKLTASKRVNCCSYGTVFLWWLEQCERHLSSEKMRWFIRDFHSYVRHEFVEKD